MPLIRNGEEVENTWRFVPDQEELPPGDQVSVTLPRFLNEAERLTARNAAIGVRLEPEDDPHALREHLYRLDLIEVHFPKYTDGRGYSQAQLLRRRMDYEGELRAVGHVLRDQLLHMKRSGFDAFETRRADLAAVLDALSEFTAFYQSAADGARSVFAARHAQFQEG